MPHEAPRPGVRSHDDIGDAITVQLQDENGARSVRSRKRIGPAELAFALVDPAAEASSVICGGGDDVQLAVPLLVTRCPHSATAYAHLANHGLAAAHIHASKGLLADALGRACTWR